MTKPELIVALDVSSLADVAKTVDALPPEILYYKVGLELFTSEGPRALEPLRERNKMIFLDLKLHDIPRTVARSVAAAVREGVAMLTVHAGGGRQMLRAAADAAAEAAPASLKIVAVTTLTSLDYSDLKELGVTRTLGDHTIALAEIAVAAGVDGLVCSPLEAAGMRDRFGAAPILVTPGVRPAGTGRQDQKRIATPKEAVEAGANFIVVGRPVLEARDPRAAAVSILKDLASCRK